MFTSHEYIKSGRRYLIATAAVAIFGLIYEMFSHQVYSNYMIFAFAIPFVLGVIPCVIASKTGCRVPAAYTTQLYAGGVMALTVGSVMKGVLDIYGTTNQKIILYPIAGAALLIAGVVLAVRDIKRQKAE